MRDYYTRANLARIPELMALAPEAAGAFTAFEREIYHASQVLPAKTKELIAVAAAHLTGCPYCIDVHVNRCRELGATREELFEAILVAASTRAGAVLSHATHMLAAYEAPAEEKEPSSSRDKNTTGGTPECFC